MLFSSAMNSTTAALYASALLAVMVLLTFGVRAFVAAKSGGVSGRTQLLSRNYSHSPIQISWAVAKVLAADEHYSLTHESSRPIVFQTVWRPNKRTTDIKMSVELLPEGEGTRVTIRAHPEWFVRADAVQRCSEELGHFHTALDAELRRRREPA